MKLTIPDVSAEIIKKHVSEGLVMADTVYRSVVHEFYSRTSRQSLNFLFLSASSAKIRPKWSRNRR
ncbi:MAG UNVERIFIED_CONTAM: hypothetical protein LVR29_33365 [Microcystis novacekii LVE1205-3]